MARPVTAKKFFAEIQERLIRHFSANRPENMRDVENISIGNLDQVLTIFTSLLERDARLQQDLKTVTSKLKLMAEEFGIDLDKLERMEDEDYPEEDDPTDSGPLSQ